MSSSPSSLHAPTLLGRLLTRRLLTLVLSVSVLPVASGVAGQEADEKKPLTLEDYGAWSTVEEVTISPDGDWVTFAYQPNEGDATFTVRQLDGDAVFTFTNGSDPEFAPGSEWVAFLTSPPEEEAEKLRQERKPVPRTAVLLDLRDPGAEAGEARTDVPRSGSFAFSDDGRFLAVKRDRTDTEAEHRGADLLVRDLETGTVRNIGNVTEWAFDGNGARLAYLVDAAEDEGNGVYVLELATGRMDPLDTDEATYEGLTWNEEGTTLAALRGTTPEGMEQRENVLLAFSELGTPAGAGGHGDGGAFPTNGVERVVYDPGQDPGFPEGFVLSEFETPEWSDDGRRIFLGVKEQREELAEDEELEADVEVWHWRDEEIQSRQEVTAQRDRRFTWASVYNLEEGRFLRLADDEMRQVRFSDHPRYAVGVSDFPYRMNRDHPDNREDFYRVDLDTGERSLVAEEVVWDMGTSPDGRWFLYLDDEHVLAHDLGEGRVVDLTERAGVDFVDRDFDRPVEKPTHGIGAWAEDGSALVLNTRHDLWRVSLESDEAASLTGGYAEAEQIRFRVVDLEEEEDGGGGFFGGSAPEVDLSEPLLLSAYGEWTKKSGLFRTREGQPPVELIWRDEMIGEGGFGSPGILKAAEADRVIFTRQTFGRFPDWWVSGPDLDDPERVTDANPQQSEYRWGSRVLVDYTDRRGNELQATLTLPAGYEEGRRYPMVIYFYEKLSQRHHEYSQPRYDDRPHMSTYASNGYLVLMPDIVYDTGRPGSSALDDVTSAARRVIELGYADPARIGLQGHSWGGYESSYILTQTDMFSAVVTGAPLTNLVSMYHINYKRSGGANQPLIEWGQGRMGVTPWENMDLYQEESPLHNAPAIETPFMILHGTADGAVDWNQGLEFYNAARRLGKEVILLTYPDEPHHLEKEANQKDFQIRMMQFFDHHLKGEAAPKWLAEGVRWLDRKRVGPTEMPGEGG